MDEFLEFLERKLSTDLPEYIERKLSSELPGEDVSPVEQLCALIDRKLSVEDVHTAAQYGDMGKMRKYVEREGHPLNLPDSTGGSYPLHQTALRDKADMALYIIERGGGVDVDALDGSGRTALHWAAEHNAVAVADVLLHNGASLESATSDGSRVVHIAAANGHTTFLSHIIQKYNAEVNSPDNSGLTPLHWAAWKGSKSMIRLLLSRGACQGTQDAQGCTPLHYAAEKGHIESCVVLVQAGSKQELLVIRNKAGFTPAELASNKGHQDVSQILDNDDTSSFKVFFPPDIKAATNNLSESKKLGRGSYGSVYRGCINNVKVAIKMLDAGSKQGSDEFLQELAVLGQIRHPHLVSLVGACFNLRSLVYEFLPNGSLEDCLERNPKRLTCKMRTCIIYQICSALIFIHSHKPQPLVHGDLKPGNILLDGNFNSKLADFGLCRFLPEGEASSLFHDTNPKGTYGYIDPDFLDTGKLTPACDVFSFGVTIMRVLTGQKIVGIKKKVLNAYKERSLMTVVDPTAGVWPPEVAEQLAYYALKCCSKERSSPELLKEMSSNLKDVLGA